MEKDRPTTRHEGQCAYHSKNSCEWLHGVHVNAPLILHGIGRLINKDGTDIYSAGFWFAEPPADTSEEDLTIDH